MSNPHDICLEPKCEETTPPKEMPSMFDMAKGFINSGKDIVGGMMAGDGLLVTEETHQLRMNICNSCEMYDLVKKRCTQCGCFMHTKSMFKKTYCPIHKWEQVVE